MKPFLFPNSEPSLIFSATIAAMTTTGGLEPTTVTPLPDLLRSANAGTSRNREVTVPRRLVVRRHQTITKFVFRIISN
jgi:hypothetical protein